MISKSAHTVVVGGGAIGSATAFWLARHGVRVTLVERDAVSEHASAKNAGNLNPIYMTPPPLIPFALESFRLHQTFKDELTKLLGERYTVFPVQRILLAFEKAHLEEFDHVSKIFADKKGFSTQLLDAKSLQTFEPRVSKNALAGLLINGNKSLNAEAMTGAFAEGAAKLGARIIRANVKQLKTAAGRVTGIVTENGEILCDAVVLATGSWVDEIKDWLGISLPIRPVKGQILRMSLPGELRYDLTCGITGLYRRNENEIWVGGTTENVGLDEAPTNAVQKLLLEGAVQLMPEMAKAKLLEHIAGIRPMTPKGVPIIQQATGWENVWLANGGCNKGILLCTGIAQTICELMLNGKTSMPVEFSN